jgi:hypothetical protein
LTLSAQFSQPSAEEIEAAAPVLNAWLSSKATYYLKVHIVNDPDCPVAGTCDVDKFRNSAMFCIWAFQHAKDWKSSVNTVSITSAPYLHPSLACLLEAVESWGKPTAFELAYCAHLCEDVIEAVHAVNIRQNGVGTNEAKRFLTLDCRQSAIVSVTQAWCISTSQANVFLNLIATPSTAPDAQGVVNALGQNSALRRIDLKLSRPVDMNDVEDEEDGEDGEDEEDGDDWPWESYECYSRTYLPWADERLDDGEDYMTYLHFMQYNEYLDGVYLAKLNNLEHSEADGRHDEDGLEQEQEQDEQQEYQGGDQGQQNEQHEDEQEQEGPEPELAMDFNPISNILFFLESDFSFKLQDTSSLYFAWLTDLSRWEDCDGDAAESACPGVAIAGKNALLQGLEQNTVPTIYLHGTNHQDTAAAARVVALCFESPWYAEWGEPDDEVVLELQAAIDKAIHQYTNMSVLLFYVSSGVCCEIGTLAVSSKRIPLVTDYRLICRALSDHNRRSTTLQALPALALALGETVLPDTAWAYLIRGALLMDVGGLADRCYTSPAQVMAEFSYWERCNG